MKQQKREDKKKLGYDLTTIVGVIALCILMPFVIQYAFHTSWITGMLSFLLVIGIIFAGIVTTRYFKSLLIERFFHQTKNTKGRK